MCGVLVGSAGWEPRRVPCLRTRPRVNTDLAIECVYDNTYGVLARVRARLVR
jgi:hypothetical protein